MTDQEIRREILRRLYELWVRNPTDHPHYVPLFTGIAPSWEDVWRNWEYLQKVEYAVKAVASGGREKGPMVRLTTRGAMKVEQEKLAASSLIQQQNQFRNRLLLRIEESHAQSSYAYWNKVREDLACTRGEYHSATEILCARGLMEESHAFQHPTLTPRGRDAVREMQRKTVLEGRFRALAGLSPQDRGRQFESVLEEAISREGWQVERDIRPPGEQLDLMVKSGREWYMLECKWEQSPVQAAVVRELYARLAKRYGVYGCLISMSGFTGATAPEGGAVNEVKAYLDKSTILLFGSQDIEDIIFQRRSFSEALSEKLDAVRVRREVIFV